MRNIPELLAVILVFIAFLFASYGLLRELWLSESLSVYFYMSAAVVVLLSVATVSLIVEIIGKK